MQVIIPRPNATKTALVLTLIGWIGFNLWSLERYMVPSCDEVYYSAPAYTLLRSGRFGMPLFNNLFGIEESYIALGRMVIFGQALVQAFFGPTLFSARIFSMLGALVLIASSYGVAASLYDRRVALWAAMMVATDWAVFMQSHSGRPEIWTSAASFFALNALLWFVRRPGTWQALLTGLSAAVLPDVHLNGLHFTIAIVFVAAYSLLVEQKRWRLFTVFGLGCVLGGVYFVIVHLFPDPALAIDQYRSFLGPFYARHLSIQSRLSEFADWLFRNYVASFSGLSLILALTYGIGILAAFAHPGRKQSVPLAVFLIVSLFSFGFTNAVKPDYYAMIWRPGWIILGTAGLLWLSERPALVQRVPWLGPAGLPRVVTGGVITILVAGDIYLAVKFSQTDYAGYVADLRQMIPSNSQIMADELWWYGLNDMQMTTTMYPLWAQMMEYSTSERSRQLTERFIQEISPNYIILDQSVGCTSTAYEQSQMIADVTKDLCFPIGTVSGPWFDTSTVYKCSK